MSSIEYLLELNHSFKFSAFESFKSGSRVGYDGINTENYHKSPQK